MMLSDVWSQAWRHHLWLPLHKRHNQQPAGGGTQQVRLQTNVISSLYITIDQSQDCSRDWRVGRILPCPRDLWPLGILHHLLLSG